MTDQLPKVVCEECVYKLDQLFDFREKCVETEGFFIEMLREISKEEVELTDRVDEQSMNEIQRNIDTLKHCVEKVDVIVTPNETEGTAIHTMQVIDEIDLADREQVVSDQELEQDPIEVPGIDCLDGDTVGMVNEHIQEVSHLILSKMNYQKLISIDNLSSKVSDHQLTMHLDDNMTVVENLTVDSHLGGLDMNYVTSMNSDDQDQEQMIHYCKNVPIKEEYCQLQERYTTQNNANKIDNDVSTLLIVLFGNAYDK